jgi:hypothetical protein
MVANQLQEAGNGFKLDSRPEMVRFYPITVRWRQIIGGYMDELTAAIEASQEIDNPYVFGAPLTEKQEIFVGRTDIIERIEQHLLDTNRPSILLYGQRRMGKTSLLRNLRRLFQSDIVPLFVDVQGASLAGDYPDLLYNIARQVRRSAEQYGGNELPAINRERLVESPFTTLMEWLDLLEKALAVSGYRLALLAFDEIEALHHVGKRGRFDETDFLSLLRHLTQTTGYYKVLLASSRTLQEFPGWSAYLVNLQAVKISYLSREAARQLVERPVESFKLRYEAEAAGRILLLTRGHPFLVQLLCHEIVSYKNRQPPDQRRLATTADVEAAVPNALEVGQLFFEDIAQNQIGETGQAILRELAFYDNGSAGQQDLSGRFGGGFEASLALLRQRDLIEIADGRYRFQVELIRRWFQGQS